MLQDVPGHWCFITNGAIPIWGVLFFTPKPPNFLTSETGTSGRDLVVCIFSLELLGSCCFFFGGFDTTWIIAGWCFVGTL